MESSLRDARGCKTLRVQLGICFKRAREFGDTKIGLSAIEVTEFHVDKLIIDDGWDDLDKELKKYSEGLRAQLELEVQRLGTGLADKNRRLTLHAKKALMEYEMQDEDANYRLIVTKECEYLHCVDVAAD
jgi:hypothetical protein